MVQDPVLCPKFNWHARRLYKYNGKRWERFIDDCDTADSWWDAEVMSGVLTWVDTCANPNQYVVRSS